VEKKTRFRGVGRFEGGDESGDDEESFYAGQLLRRVRFS
jgi:hypothetical protein